MRLVLRCARLLRRLLDVLLTPAADPRETFADAYQRQLALLALVEQAQHESASFLNRLIGRIEQLQRRLPRLEDQARRGLVMGREDLARLALQRRQLTLHELQAMQAQAQETEREQERLAAVNQQLMTQIEAFYARQQVLAARYSAAEAQVRFTESLNGVSEDLVDLGRALEQAEQRAEYMAARASAIDRLIQAGVLEAPALPIDPVDRQLSQLDLDEAVETQLSSLRRQMGGTTHAIGRQ